MDKYGPTNTVPSSRLACNVAVAEREHDVPGAWRRLQQAVESLEKTWEELQPRLTPFSRPEQPCPVAMEPKDPEPRAPFAGEVEGLMRRIECIQRSISYQNTRLEL